MRVTIFNVVAFSVHRVVIYRQVHRSPDVLARLSLRAGPFIKMDGQDSDSLDPLVQPFSGRITQEQRTAYARRGPLAKKA